MRQKNIFIMLTITLLAAALVLTGVFIHLYRNVYYIPERAVTDLCTALQTDGVILSPSLVARKREDGVIYMGSDDNEDTANRLAESDIRCTFVIPDGTLYLHYSGDQTEFLSDFRFRYRRADTTSRLTDDFSYAALADDASSAVTDTEYESYSQIARAFLERGDGGLSKKNGGPSIETVIADIRSDTAGAVYVRCLRRIDGVEITENDMICVIENGVVTEADGKWCFLTFGKSYSTQVSDITNILYMMKRIVSAGGDDIPEKIEIESISHCYSLYFLTDEDSFCLIPCIRVETDTYGILVFNQLDGTLYTRIAA